MLDDFGVESTRAISSSRGAESKKLRSRVMRLRLGVQDVRLKDVRFARLFQGRSVVTLRRFNVRKDERSPLKSVLSRTGARGTWISICKFSKRGVWQRKCLRASGRKSVEIPRVLTR